MTTASPASAQLAHLELELSARSCPICASTLADEFAPANVALDRLDGFAFASRKLPEYMHFRLVVCRVCDVLYASPAPNGQTLDRAYKEAAFDAAVESRYAALTYAAFLPKIVGQLRDLDGALDIGTGDGAFLEQLLRQGFTNVVGVEPSAAPIAAAKPEIRPLIRQSPFRSADFESERLRLVTCFQTLEHVSDPLELCADAGQLLKPGGALFVVCHDRRALLARLMGQRSPIFDIEHLQLFCSRSIQTLLKRAGFRSVEVHRVVNRYPLSYWIRLLPAPAGLKSAVLNRLETTGLGKVSIAAPVGNLAAIAYK